MVYKPVFLTKLLFICTFVFTACFYNNNNALFNLALYLKNTPAADYLAQRSLALEFTFNNRILYGSGWVYASQNDFYYVVTNLHVGKILSFLNQGEINTYEADKWQSLEVKELVTKIGFIDVLNKQHNYQQVLAPNNFIDVNNPQIIYTSVKDQVFQQTFNNNNSGYKGRDNAFYSGIIDVVLLEFFWPLKLMPNSFANWLTNYQQNPTVFLTQPLDQNNYYSWRYYMGGFLAKQQNGISFRQWQVVSDFNIHTEITQRFQNTINYNFAAPITYIDSQNMPGYYVSIAKDAYVYAYLGAGASGSLVVAEINKKYVGVGLYWGVSEFEINGINRTLGTFSLLVSQNNGKNAYDVIQGFNYAIAYKQNNIKN